MAKQKAPSTADQIAEVKQRLGETDARINALTAEEQEVNRTIATRLSEGRELGDLQDRRRKLRDDIEDLGAAVPLIRARLDELREQFQREARAREVDGFADRAAGLSSRIAALDDELLVVLGRAHKVASEMSAFVQESRGLGFGLSARFQDGTLIAWRIQTLMMGCKGFDRPPAAVRPLTLRETAGRELDSVVARAQHAVGAVPTPEQEPVPA